MIIIKNKIKYIAALLVILTGLGILCYPFVITFISDQEASYVTVDYDKKVQNMKKEEIKNRKEKAKNINKEINTVMAKADEMFQNAAKNKKSKQKEYKVGEIIGSVVIPKINVSLPVYEGTTNDVIEQGIGHLTTSSLPTGGKGNHCVLTGHSGLSYASMFSDLDLMKKNDVFYIKFLDDILKYKVDRINIIEPQYADDYIQCEKDKDLCTLITCTPKTVNSHRLLVRGHRVKYTPGELDSIKGVAMEGNNLIIYLALLGLSLLFMLILVIIVYRIKKRHKPQNSTV